MNFLVAALSFELSAKFIVWRLNLQDNNGVLEEDIKKNLLVAYRISLQHYERMFSNDDPETYQAQSPAGAIKSEKMQACERISAALDPKWETMRRWIKSADAAVEMQTFEREEIHKWVDENNLFSRYKLDDFPVVEAKAPKNKISAEQRQDARWAACETAGLQMPTNTYQRYPVGVTEVAERLGITRQTLTEDLDKRRNRSFNR